MSLIKPISGSQKIVFLIVLSFGIAGLVDGAYPKVEDASYLLHALFLSIALFVWCGLHAEESEIKPPRGSKILCGLLGILGAPLYLFRAFGFKAGGFKTLLGLLAIIVALLLYEAAFRLSLHFLR